MLGAPIWNTSFLPAAKLERDSHGCFSQFISKWVVAHGAGGHHAADTHGSDRLSGGSSYSMIQLNMKTKVPSSVFPDSCAVPAAISRGLTAAMLPVGG